MPNRVRLTWNRNQDKETDHYRVFRSETEEINEQNRMEHLIMRVAHPKEINPIRIESEFPTRYSSRTYLLEHKNILLSLKGEAFPFTVKINDNIVTAFTLDVAEGRIIFDEDILPESIVECIDYTFDGVQVWDYGIEEEDKTYYGPEAKDTSPPGSPPGLSMAADYDRNRVVLRWGVSQVTGKRFYYQIDAAVDNTKYSKLSVRRVGSLKEPLADRSYSIERSLDGVKWQDIAKVKGTVFYEYVIDRQAPNPIKNLRGEAYLYSSNSLAQVTLNWDRIVDTTYSQTSLYRVRATNRVGAVSEPSNIVGPVPFKVEMKEITIRRKVYDGTLPTLAGDDATTAASTLDLETTQFIEDVPDNHKYIYGIWVTDRGGNSSAISYVVVTIGDATAPSTPLSLTSESFQLIVG